FSSRRRHTRSDRDWSSDVCSSDLSGRGSGQVSLQTRSGTNQFHGAGFVFNRNSALAASDFFANQKGTKPTYINRNQFGGRLGGQIGRASCRERVERSGGDE